MKTNRFVPMLFLAVATAACSKGSDSPAAPANTNTTTLTYSGVFAGTKEGGTFQLSTVVPALSSTASLLADVAFAASAPVAATGTLKITGGATITLTGTYDASTKAFTLSGSSYALTATVASNAVSGSYTGPSTSGSVSALAAPPGITVVMYCGTYSGSESGRWNFATANGLIGGVAATPDGSIDITGTLVGFNITMTWHPNPTDVGNATGTTTGVNAAGSWSTNTPGDHGSWSGSTVGC
jgi:hypothetical protein